MPLVVLGFGSNLGNRKSNIKEAYKLLEEALLTSLTCSSFYETPPWGNLNQPPFINSVGYCYSLKSPFDILEVILRTEKKLGRERTQKWGPRLIDIDLLFFGDETISNEKLTVPHPYLHQRLFVLEPLVEILPNLEHPTLKTTSKQLLFELKHS